LIYLSGTVLALSNSKRRWNRLAGGLALLRPNKALTIESIRADEISTPSVIAKKAFAPADFATLLIGLRGVVECAELRVSELPVVTAASSAELS